MPLSIKIKPGAKKIDLGAIDPASTGPFKGKDDPRVQRQIDDDARRLCDLQERLYAENKQSLLIILQAMDTGGKDGTIRHVVGPLDSRGCEVVSFKPPSVDEAAHDFLWRVHAKTPRKGEIVIFNRSHYEEVLVVRVMGLQPKEVWSKRFDQINAFEKMLVESGTRIVKIFLHISKDEQKRRLEARLSDPSKLWKFDPSDIKARARWDDYQQAYGAALARCSTDWAPWHVVPADSKWYRNLAVARLLVDALEAMNPRYPDPVVDPKTITIE